MCFQLANLPAFFFLLYFVLETFQHVSKYIDYKLKVQKKKKNQNEQMKIVRWILFGTSTLMIIIKMLLLLFMFLYGRIQHRSGLSKIRFFVCWRVFYAPTTRGNQKIENRELHVTWMDRVFGRTVCAAKKQCK